MKKNLFLALALILGLAFTGCGSKNDANSFPQKNIEMIVPFGAGGGTDTVGRTIAQSMEKTLGKPIVITNKTGGAGAVGMTTGAKAAPDGYTLTVVTREIVSLPLMNLAQITADDFDLLGLVNLEPAIILVAKDSKYKSAKDLIEAARMKPGSVKMASTAQPNFYVLGIEIDQNVKFNQVPFNGAAEAIPAVLGGHTDFTIVTPGEAISQIKSGQLRAIGLMDEERFPTLPEVPTLKEQGYDIISGTWRGIGVPKGTPDAVKTKLADAIEAGIKDPAFIDIMTKSNTSIRYMNAADFTEFVKKDEKTIKKIVDALK
ncbi:tripartite tricarboxylate transporter substrate binding protein [Ilyobacter sp.]|jgi:tripartite-type tricarboxylate transporter receptor subunit TctC|uniref:tripartite tricarboxylate transporter substrate binding protein n=1 Tax=Ilyobacter sp. TaxID=3100343 RepID=UPI003566AE93